MNENKRKGSLTELQIMTEFVRLGYNVSSPYGDCERYDFIADIKGRLIRVQCKTPKSYDEGNSFDIDFRKSRYIGKGELTTTYYQNDEIDYFATYYKGRAYLIPVEECNSKKRLRLFPPSTGQTSYVKFAENYELERVVNRLLEEAIE